MGKETFTRETYRGAYERYAPKEGPATEKAEQKAHSTGKLNPLVDPAGFNIIRRSLCRFEKQASGLWVLTIGAPLPTEVRVDTTGSMGSNVDIALRRLPDMYDLCSGILPKGYDLQIAIGIFGDVVDRFVLCRPQFEMTAPKIVEQLTLMVPERMGGDTPEDPHYGLFGAAYLTDRYINKIGLKGYDFTVTDAPARNLLDKKQLIRIYSDEVFSKAAENGFQIDANNLPTTAEIVQDLLKLTHAFVLQIDNDPVTTRFWSEIYGRDRVVKVPNTELLPQVEAVIMGLTEGTLGIEQVEKFLQRNNVLDTDARKIARSVANIPIGAQVALPNFDKRPRKGALFRNKTDIWPIDQKESAESELSGIGSEDESNKPGENPWL